jgi:hypothetical protein
MLDSLVRAGLMVAMGAGLVVAVFVPRRNPQWAHGRRVAVWLWAFPFAAALVWWGYAFIYLEPGTPIPAWAPWLSRIPYLGFVACFGWQVWLIARIERGSRDPRPVDSDCDHRLGGGGVRGGVGTGAGQPHQD